VKVSLEQALKRLPAHPTHQYPQGAPFVTMMAGGTMSVEVYAPKDADLQEPHRQDELYFIARGSAKLRIADQLLDAAVGDAFFVAAGVAHRFESFSDDFVTWVVFYGPENGE
jgi:mannose-6-phosphate isomerase-like protein (cupin superfamily)